MKKLLLATSFFFVTTSYTANAAPAIEFTNSTEHTINITIRKDANCSKDIKPHDQKSFNVADLTKPCFVTISIDGIEPLETSIVSNGSNYGAFDIKLYEGTIKLWNKNLF